MSLDEMATGDERGDEADGYVQLEVLRTENANDSGIRRRFAMEETTRLVREVDARIDPCLAMLGLKLEDIRVGQMADADVRREIARAVVPLLVGVSEEGRSLKISELLIAAIGRLHLSKKTGVPLEQQVMEVRISPTEAPQTTVLERVSGLISTISQGLQDAMGQHRTKAAS